VQWPNLGIRFHQEWDRDCQHRQRPNEKLSVIVSTMHALSDSIVAEADLGDCRSTILKARKGRVVILSVPGKTEGRMLAGMATPNTSLGMLLSCCAMACREVTLASPVSLSP
jgi:predicted regulator of Ras-like GTPase activity (Roadblock/LC7/MglB family)